jgi:hypothetical protein
VRTWRGRAGAAGVAALALLVAGCDGYGSGGDVRPGAPTAETAGPTAPAPPEPRPAAPLPGIPADLAGYESWTRINAAPIPPRERDPHSGTKNVYASAPPGPDGVFPDGAIVVKDANRPGRDHLGLVAVMRKVAGVDPAHGDWEFVEYARESADASFTVLARDGVCWGCHAGAADADWVWTSELGLDR